MPVVPGEWLLLDCGNSRIKGAILGPDGWTPLPPRPPGVATRAEGLREWLSLARATIPPSSDLPARSLATSVLVSNVRGEVFAQDLERACVLCGFESVRFARHGAGRNHLASRYDLTRLGIDRYLAVLAAIQRLPAAEVAIVDCGTALTVDFVTADGLHTGGVIVPGRGPMLQALGAQTAALGRERNHPLASPPENAQTHSLASSATGGTGRLMPPADTRSAIELGAACALQGGVLTCLARHDPDAVCRVLVTGGDAPLVVEAVAATGRSVEVVDALVLLGLLAWAGVTLPERCH